MEAGETENRVVVLQLETRTDCEQDEGVIPPSSEIAKVCRREGNHGKTKKTQGSATFDGIHSNEM